MEEMNREYDHTQRAPLHWILNMVALAMAAGTILLVSEPGAFWALGFSSILTFFFAQCFKFLSVTDQKTFLSVRFGPIPMFGITIQYDDIVSVEAARSTFLDGWGVHWMPGRGWIYNLWGFTCVRVTLKTKTLRVGTDDVEGLLEFLNGKAADTQK